MTVTLTPVEQSVLIDALGEYKEHHLNESQKEEGLIEVADSRAAVLILESLEDKLRDVGFL